jgi:CheY-like chemotaxis protein
MKLLVIDDGFISEFLKSSFENHPYIKIIEINTSNCAIPEILKILKELNNTSEDDKIIFINAHLKLKDPKKYRSDCNGLEILKHIRLTKKLDSNDFKPALLPIIVGIFFPPEYYIRKSPDNIIICSPKCKTIFIPDFDKNEFIALIEKLLEAGPFRDYEGMKEQIKDYIHFIEKDYIYFTPVGIPTSHDIRNEIGISILLEELVPDLENLVPNERALREIKKTIEEKFKKPLKKISAKKVAFLEHYRFSGTIRTEPSENRNELWYIGFFLPNFRNSVQNKKFILIDDEYHKGWAYALCFGLFGREPKNIGKGFLCFDSFEDAKCWFNRICGEFEELLTKWAEVDKRLFREISSNNQQNSSNTINELKSLRKQLENLFPYDLVFLDLRLEPEDKNRSPEELSGMELLKLIKEFNRGIPVIIFTASEKATVLETALKNGADGYWIKCVDDGMSLIKMIKKLLPVSERLKRLWVKIRMVEKKEWFGFYSWVYNSSTHQWDAGIDVIHRSEDKKEKYEQFFKQIPLFLKHAFNLLYNVITDTPLRTLSEEEKEDVCCFIVTLLGIIQEWRHSNCYDKSSGERCWGLKKDEAPPSISNWDKEKDLRDLRNRCVHKGGGEITIEKVIEKFEFTLDRLLNI